MHKFVDLTGKRFDRLTVIELRRNAKKEISWLCRCDCGNEKIIKTGSLNRGTTKSCGCLHKETAAKLKFRHGKASHEKRASEYTIWLQILSRCLNEKNIGYMDYGGRGIFVCDEWKESFDNFYSDMGDRPSKLHSIDRIDVDGGYNKENCRWALPVDQARNRRIRSDNKTGHNGIRTSRNGKFVVGIDKKHIGTFDSIEDAVKARQDAEVKYWGKAR